MIGEIPTAATIYADDSFPTPESSLRIRAEWENVDVSAGDEMLVRRHLEERLDQRIEELKKEIKGPNDSSEAKARKEELQSLKQKIPGDTKEKNAEADN